MLSDDVYRSKLAAVFAGLKQAAAALADVAHVEQTESADFARLSLIPGAAGACPVEIMLRADQLYDIQIGNEFYEDCAIERIDLFLPLISAVTRGDVIQRRHISAATGTELEIETIVPLPGGEAWRKSHVHPGAARSGAATVFEDRRFVPYRR
jgi:hypothetical protein